ncbi:ExsB family transcriptional regulator [Rubneribacter sp.]
MTVETGFGQEVGVEPLGEFFARTPRLAVAFSGGCDSSYLLAAAVRAGCEVRAYGVRTAFQPSFETQDALRLARELGADFQLIGADVLSRADICANPPDRCYRCKTFIFSTILEHMAKDGFGVLADGTNATDDPANRPGFRALAELGVVSPLRRAGLTKDGVRAASRDLGLFTAGKPSFSCLAVHVPAGKPLTAASLARAAQAPAARAAAAARREGGLA